MNAAKTKKPMRYIDRVKAEFAARGEAWPQTPRRKTGGLPSILDLDLPDGQAAAPKKVQP